MPGLFDGTSLERPVTCEVCSRELSKCACPRGGDGKVLLPSAQQPRVRIEKRRGKPVTVVAGLDPVASDLPGLLKEFKASLGAGGTVAQGEIELQGDHKDRVVAALKAKGYKAK